MFCTNCGKELIKGANFCIHCGYGIENKSVEADKNPYETPSEDSKKESIKVTEKVMNKITKTINEAVGGEGAVDLRLRDLFSDVFKKHTNEEVEELFICGTSKTTPSENEISTSWPKPWLYARVGVILAVATVFMYICCSYFENLNAYPGFMVLGSFLMPITVLIFFFEVNAPRNISFYELISLFLIGGTASIVVTMLIYGIVPDREMDIVVAMAIGLVEELGKVIITAFVIKKIKKTQYLLNGLLIGGAVGAGFAAFESAGYAFRACIGIFDGVGGLESVVNMVLLRGLYAPGGHVAWAAITGAAIMLCKGKEEFSWNFITDKKFYILLLACVLLHGIWDFVPGLIVQILLIIFAWIVLLVLINAGLKEINQINKNIRDDVDQEESV